MRTGRRAIKSLVAVLCAVLCVFSLWGCNVSETSLPKGMDPDKALAKAQSIATSISKGEFEAVADQFSDELKEDLTAEKLREGLEAEVEKRGEITDFLSWSMRGASDDEAGEYAVVVLVCKCERGSASFMICLDKENKICGLSVK